MGAVADAESSPEDGARVTVHAIAQLCERVGVPSMAGLGIEADAYAAAIPAMAIDALASGSPANNPRVPLADDLERLYRAAYFGGTEAAVATAR